MGKILLTLDSEKLHQMGLTQTSIYLAREVGDKVSEENEITVSSVLLPDFSSLSTRDRELAPRLVLSADTLDMGEMGRKRKKSMTVEVRNEGKRTLQVRTLQVFNKALSVSLSERNIAPGETAKLKVTVAAKYLSKVKSSSRVHSTAVQPHEGMTSVMPNGSSPAFFNVKLTFDGNWNMISPMLATSRSSSTRGCATAAMASIIPAIYAKLLFITILVFSFCDKDSAKKRGNEQKKELITNKSQIAFERFGRTDKSCHRRSLFPPCNN